MHNFNVSAGRISALGLEPGVLKYRSSIVVVHIELIFFQCASEDKGGKFLKKLWCCVGGSITR